MTNTKELIKYSKELTVLFVEDHKDLRENSVDMLKNFFTQVHSAVDGDEAFTKYQDFYKNNSKYYDIVISDIQMPKIDGVELTKNIYTINPSQIIIILSAFDDSKYLLPLINLGIERFIKKPIDYKELIKVLLLSSKKLSKKDNKLNLSHKINLDDNFSFDREKNTLFNKNKNIYLTKYEIIFMQLLTTNVGKIYTNEEIVINYTFYNENLDAQNIRKLISKLRKKLPKDIIESIYGIGYRIVLENV